MKYGNYFGFIAKGVAILGLAIFLLWPSLANARQGCCSWHGGVCGCGCCDGTPLSSTCLPYYPQCSTIKIPTPTYTPTPKPTPTPVVCTINGINYYSENTCRSEEHKNGIGKLYNSLLGRNATKDEVNYYANKESDIKKIEEDIRNSDEYKQKHPSPTPTISPTVGGISDSNTNGLDWFWWLLIGGGLFYFGNWVFKQTKNK